MEAEQGKASAARAVRGGNARERCEDRSCGEDPFEGGRDGGPASGNVTSRPWGPERKARPGR